MAAILQIRVGGVPEHFNIPLYYGIQQGVFAAKGIDLHWSSYPGGTGAMLADLREDRLDIATLLTEGAISGILSGVPAKIIKFYVDSPLVWGIHVRAGSGITMDELRGKRYAISRYQSGSHLMPYVNASYKRLNLHQGDFIIVKDLDGARKALKNGEADIFFWEKFITQPYVDNGEFERIGECPTPWPSFVMVGTENILRHRYPELVRIFGVLHDTIRNLVNSGDMIQMVAEEFGLSHFDAVRWYAEVEWNRQTGLDTEVLSSAVKRLESLHLIPEGEIEPVISRLTDYRAIQQLLLERENA